MLYLIYLILSYKYTEYRIEKYVEKLSEVNIEYEKKIISLQKDFTQKSTLAYKNKILKANRQLKSPGEEVVFLISQESYDRYTLPNNSPKEQIQTSNLQELSKEESLLATMTIYQKWVYFLRKRDIR